jgi:hypothetical protein
MSVRPASVLKGAATAGLLLLGVSFAPVAEARIRCSYSGPPQNLLTVTADRGADSPDITRRGDEIVVRADPETPIACSGGVATVLNTDSITLLLRGGFPDAYVLLAEGPFAPGATPEAEGVSEIEIEFRGPVWAVVYGTAGADEFQWGSGSTHQAGLNLNAGEAGDQDVDVDITLSRAFASLLAKGLGGDDTITTSPRVVSPASVFSGGGSGNDRVSAGVHAGGTLEGESGDDVLVASRLADNLIGGPGNDRLVGGRGPDRFDLFEGARGRDLILAGPGRDQINSRDSDRERVRCGPGRDRVTADREDRLRGCEIIRRAGQRTAEAVSLAWAKDRLWQVVDVSERAAAGD